MLEGILAGLSTAFSIYNITMVIAGCLIGTLIGMLPGLGPMSIIAIMIPVSIQLGDPSSALIMLAGVYYGAIFGGSTSSILKFVIEAPAETFIIATEPHIIHQMEKSAPAKQFIGVPGQDGGCNCNNCPFMELNTLEKLYLCLLNGGPAIHLPEDLRQQAVKPLQRMLELSKGVPLKKA